MKPLGQQFPFENEQIPQILDLCIMQVQVPALRTGVNFHGRFGQMCVTRFYIYINKL